MHDIDSTPKLVARVLETIARNLDIVRRRVARPLTLAEKVLLGHLDDPEARLAVALELHALGQRRAAPGVTSPIS